MNSYTQIKTTMAKTSIYSLSLLVYLLFLILGVNSSLNYSPNVVNCLVTTKLGTLQGEVELSRNGKKYCSFKGIPYANTPKRFEEAKMGEAWNGILDATKFGSRCPQLKMFTNNFIGHEDCLFLNIHYPLEDQCDGIVKIAYDSLPVMTHIHGGAYEMGSGEDYGPKYIMDQCILFISMNYRLSALGFLSTNDGLIPGNLGLKDIVLALNWTQQNIDSFGGNPYSVTLIGISSGSFAISTLIASHAAEGLFHRAIAQSGSGVGALGIRKNPSSDARELAKRLNCTIEDPNNTIALKQCLLAADVEDIVLNQRLYKWYNDPLMPFAPIVENLNSINPILTVNPLYKYLSGDFNRVPIIMGFTEHEGLLQEAFAVLSDPKLLAELNTNWTEIAPINIHYDEKYIPQEEKNKISREIRNYYFGNKSISWETSQGLIDLYSDRLFVQSIMDNVELHSRYAPVYPYVFSYKEGFCFVCSIGYPKKVSTHGTDAHYVFVNDMFPEIKQGTFEAEFSERLLKLWTTFARTGNPSETWPTRNLMKPYKNDGVQPNFWYSIDEEMQELPNYLQDRRNFWRNIALRHYDYPVYY